MTTEPSIQDRVGALNVEAFINGYIGAALWTDSPDPDHEVSFESAGYEIDDLPVAVRRLMRDDCLGFVAEAQADLELVCQCADDWAHAGFHFWLTRNGHGAGFWDGDYPEAIGQRLTEASHGFGEQGLYMGDDDQIYVC